MNCLPAKTAAIAVVFSGERSIPLEIAVPGIDPDKTACSVASLNAEVSSDARHDADVGDLLAARVITVSRGTIRLRGNRLGRTSPIASAAIGPVRP